jgi:chromate reductase
MHITLLAGSPRKGSISLRVALHLQEQLKKVEGMAVALINMQDEHLPPIQEVWTNAQKAPKDKQELYEKMDATDGFIVVTPEYNGGYSPALKNFLDHFPKQVYQRKPWGVVSSSTGAMGGMRAALQVQLLGYGLMAIGSPKMLVTPFADKKFAEDGTLMDDSFEPAIRGFLEDYLWLAGKIC